VLSFLAALPLLAAGIPASGQDGSIEFAVKATYLYKFAPFVEWPDAAFRSRTSPIVLCVVGDDPFGGILDRAVKGQRVGERPIVAARFTALDPDVPCHIMYVMGSEAEPAAAALELARGKPVLTVTDAARGSVAKGIVHFVVQDNRVRFEIDDHQAAVNGLKISSKVLSLATSVRPRS
jgi:hypothetical protein